MDRKTLLLTMLLIGLWQIGNAQLTLSGEFRVRSLLDNGFMTPAREGDDMEFSTDQRTRLNLRYDTEKYTTKIVFQDARIWGSDDLVSKVGTWGSSSSFGLHEAWLDIRLSKGANVKIGRQEWNYDNMRVLSYRNWITSALSYDGVLLQTRNSDKSLSLDIGLSYNNNGRPTGIANNADWQVDKQKTMNFVYLKKSITKSSYVSLLASLSGKVDTTNMAVLGTGTHGVVAVYNKGKFAEDGLFGVFEGYYQHGTDIVRGSDEEYRSIQAYLLNAEVGLRALSKRLEVSVGTEVLSGRDYSNTDADYKNTRHSFDLQYGMRFPAYGGNMNHFIVQDSYLLGTKGGGYIDPYLKVKYKVNKKSTIAATAFNPILSTKVRAHNSINPTTNKPSGAEVDVNGLPVYWEGSLGQYVDVNFTHKFNKEIVLKVGVSYANVSDIKNQMVFGYRDAAEKKLHKLGANYFGWVVLSVRPTFFRGTIKKKPLQ